MGAQSVKNIYTSRNLKKSNTYPYKVIGYQNKAKSIIKKGKKMSATIYESIQQKKKNENENSLEIQAKSLTSIYRSRVIEAYRNHCIFTVFGNYGTIRKALLKRGWLEKLPPSRFSKLQNLSEDVLLRHAKQGNEYETVIISKLMTNLPAFFVWQAKGQRDLYVDVKPYRNRIRRSQILDFSTKVGLIGCAEQELWHRQEGVAGMLYPRFYRMGCNQEEQTEFIHDFRLTQCRSLLRYLIDNKDSPENIIDFENGSISPAIVNFAIVQVKKQSEDCEMLLESEPEPVSDIEWNDFVLCSRKVLNLSERIKCTYRELIDYMKTANAILAKTEDEHPDYKWDGYKNLWILKPGYQSRGLGIVIRNTLEDILRWSTSHSSRSYIVQKYIGECGCMHF